MTPTRPKAIRQKIIEDDRLEAVIGLAPNLFYGTGIPDPPLCGQHPPPEPQRQRLEKLRLLKQGLMDDLLTGRVRVGGGVS
jgi:N-6 DNA Methylase